VVVSGGRTQRHASQDTNSNLTANSLQRRSADVQAGNSDSNGGESEGVGVNAADSDVSADHDGNCGKDIAL
jgi:hypothetical protein